MNHELELDQRIHELGAAMTAPDVPLEEDLARGRRRLGRQRLLVTGGAVAGVVVIALGTTLVGGPDEGRASLGPAASPTVTEAPTTPQASTPAAEDRRTGGELLKAYRDVVAEHIDPAGTHLQRKPDNVQSGGGLGTKLGWSVPGQEGLGMVQVFVGKGWWSFIGADCNGGAQCRTETVDGITAKILTWNGATTVLVTGEDGPVAITVDALFGNNSLVPVEGMEIPLDDLVRAAGDERLTPATPAQVRNAGSSMGFPDPGDLRTLEEVAASNAVAPDGP